MPGVVVLAEIGEAGRVVDGGEVGSVEGAGEVFADGAALGGAGVDADLEDVHLFGCFGDVGGGVGFRDRGIGYHRKGDQIGAFVLEAEEAVAGEVRGVRPVLEVGRGEDADGKFLSIGDHGDPGFGGCVPKYFGISKLGAVGRDDGILCILRERVASIF